MTKKLPKKAIAHYEATDGSAARAKYMHHAGAMHRIEFEFQTPEGRITVAMDHDIAAAVLEQGITAYQAIQRPLRIARNIPFP